MTYDNSRATRRYPGWLENAVGLTQFLENVKQLAGQASVQPDIVTEAPLDLTNRIDSSHATRFDATKDVGQTVSEILRNIFEYEASSSETIGLEMRLQAAIENTSAGPRQLLGEILFGTADELNGRIQLSPGVFSVGVPVLTVSPEGFLGINTETPEYEVDVPTGRVNVSGNYRKNNVIIADWTEVLGVPNKVTTTGPARVSGLLKTTLPTGTAPLVAASTTLCPRLNTDLFEGYSWHPGVEAIGSADYTSVDTDILVEPVNRAGVWDITAAFNIGCDIPDNGKTINAKILDGAGNPIGPTVSHTGRTVTIGIATSGTSKNLMITGQYVSALGTENIRAVVSVPTGTGGFAEAVLTMAWQRP